MQDDVKELYGEEVSDAEMEAIEELNKKHALIHLHRTYILTEKVDSLGNDSFSMETRASFRTFYENFRIVLPDGRRRLASDLWLRSPLRRTYLGITFDPTTIGHTDSEYNLWKGFDRKAVKGDCSKYWAHVRDNICSGDASYYGYVRKWLACVFQYPDRVHTSLVLCGSQGTGKNAFVEPLGALFGPHYVSLSGLKELLSSFNFHLKNAVLIHANEAIWGNTKSGLGTLKAMVTDRLCLIEGKGRDSIMVKNYKHVIISSNESFPVHIDSDDRRFFVLSVSDAQKENHAYFKEIQAELDAGGYEALLYDLLHEDLTFFNPRVFPWSGQSFEIKMRGASSSARYIYEVLRSGYIDTEMEFSYKPHVAKSLLYGCYRTWCRNNGESSMPCSTFGTYLKKIFPLMRDKRATENGKRYYAYVLPPLHFARKDFCIAFKGEHETLFGSSKESL